jgi:hypothetical protein
VWASKRILVISFDNDGIAHNEFISLCQTLNLHCYWEILQRLRKQVCWKCPEWLWSPDWLTHHAPAYTVLSVLWCLAPKALLQFLTLLTHLIWLLVKFSFFLIIRLQLWGHCVKDVPAIQGEQLTYMWVIPEVSCSCAVSIGRNAGPVA